MANENHNPMSAFPVSDEVLWEIDRYLLTDPSLDRDRFEARMLSDPAIALAVADEVQRLQSLSRGLSATAKRGSGRDAASRGAGGRAAALLPLSLLALAASVLWLLLMGRDAGHEDGRPRAEVADGQLQAIAQQWLALDRPSEDAERSTVASQLEFAALDSLEPLPLREEATDGDWILQAAADFYRHAEPFPQDASL